MKRKKIICGTDFSDLATHAATAAAVLSIRSRDTLVLVHVLDESTVDSKKKFSLLEKAIRSRFHWEAERLRKLGATVKKKFLIGSPYQRLVETAQKPDTRLLIIGAIGHKAAKRWLLGSVAERVAESSPVPTLVLRDPATLEKWASGKMPLNVFVATDFSTSSDAALAWVADLERIGKCKVTVGHVDWPPDNYERLGAKGPMSFLENPTEVQQVLERELKEKAERTLGSEPVELRIEPGWGRPDAHLLNLAKTENADLLVVGTRQREGLARLAFGSVSRSLLHHAPMSVAVVPMRKGAVANESIPVIRRVLVTTDFSRLGNAAIPLAYAPIAAGGTVHLIHVMPPNELPNPLLARHQENVVTETKHKKQIEAARKKLRALVPKNAGREIKTEIEIVEDRDVARAICTKAERAGVDLICVGSHGRSGISKVILGSVAQSVMANSKRPLLIIPPGKD